MPGIRQKPVQLSPLAQLVAAQHIAPAFSPIVVAGIVRLAEFCLIALIGVATYFGYVYPAYGVFDWYYIATAFGVARSPMIAFQAADIYQVHAFRNPVSQCARLTVAWSVVFLVVVTLAFFAQLGGMYSRLWLASFYAIGLFTLYAVGSRSSASCGAGPAKAGSTAARWSSAAASRAKISSPHSKASATRTCASSAYSTTAATTARPTACAGLHKLGTVDDLVEFARRTRVDLVIFSLPISAESRILQMLKKLWVLPVDIRLSAHTNKLRFRPRSYSYIGAVPVLDVFDRPIADWDVVMKWLFDKVVGGLALIAALPVMAIVALAIKLDSRGPGAVQAEALRLQQ